jgi:hypothetical protein
LRRPEIMTTHEVPANRLNYMRMLQAVSQAELDLPEIDQLIKTEASIRYRLLRDMNSVRFGFRNEIHSVRHALAILGDREVRRWVRLIATVGAGQDKTSDLVLCALVRARFGELLAPLTRHDDSDLFLRGLLPMLDVMLEMPMSEVLEKIPLDSETKAVLRGELGLLHPIYLLLMLAHESGEWEAARASAIASIWMPTRSLLRTGSLNNGPGKFPAERERRSRSRSRTSGNGLLCKTYPFCHLRARRRTSTISLFSLASFPRRPSASQAVPGGATDPTTDNRYAEIIFFANTSCFTVAAYDHCFAAQLACRMEELTLRSEGHS